MVGARHGRRPNPTSNPNPDPNPDPKRARNRLETGQTFPVFLEFSELQTTNFLLTQIVTKAISRKNYNVTLKDVGSTELS